jgi:hypothetical protein
VGAVRDLVLKVISVNAGQHAMYVRRVCDVRERPCLALNAG